MVSWPAISRPVPSWAASLTLISPAVTRSARSETASSAGFSIFFFTRSIKIPVQAHRTFGAVVRGGEPGQADVGVVLEELVVLVGHTEQLADHDGGHRQRQLR